MLHSPMDFAIGEVTTVDNAGSEMMLGAEDEDLKGEFVEEKMTGLGVDKRWGRRKSCRRWNWRRCGSRFWDL